MTLPKYCSLLDHLKTALGLSIAVGSLIGIIALISMPFFLDNLLDLVLFCLLIPSVLGCLAALIFFLFQQVIPSIKRSADKLKLPFAYMISFLLFLVAASLSGSIYLFVSDNWVLHFFVLLVYLVIWLFILSRLVQVNIHLSIRHLSIVALCFFISSIVLHVGLAYLRDFTVPARVFIYGVDGATWSIINPLIEKGQLSNIAKFKREGTYGKLKSIKPMQSPTLWTTIATGKGEKKHGIKDFFVTHKSLRTKRIWDMFEAQGMSIGIFRWLVTWPPSEVNGFVIPDFLARDDRTFPPKYRAINALRIEEKSQSLNIPTYTKLTWSLVNMGLRMSTLREIGWSFFLDWFRGGDTISRYPLKRRAEFQINRDVFVYLLKEYQPQFVTFYDNGVDALSHKYWKYYEPKYFPEVKSEEIRRYGSAIPAYYELVDQVLGDLLQYFSDNTLVVVLSDHGLQAANEEGKYKQPYLQFSKLLRLLELDSIVYGITHAGTYDIQLKDSSRIDLLKQVEEKLKEVKVVETGEKLFRFIPDENDEASLVAEMRNKTADLSYHIRIGQMDLGMEEIIYKYPPKSGEHHINGILLMKGPNIRSGIEISDATIIDVTPTILYLEKMPISQEQAVIVIYTTSYKLLVKSISKLTLYTQVLLTFL